MARYYIAMVSKEVTSCWAQSILTKQEEVISCKRPYRCGHRQTKDWVLVPFCANGKVISTYDHPAKAKRVTAQYARGGMKAKVVYFDTDDLSEYTGSIDDDFAEAERKMLTWTEKTVELDKKLKGITD